MVNGDENMGATAHVRHRYRDLRDATGRNSALASTTKTEKNVLYYLNIFLNNISSENTILVNHTLINYRKNIELLKYFKFIIILNDD